MRAHQIIGVTFGVGIFFCAIMFIQPGFERYLSAQMSAPLEGMVYAQAPLDARAAVSPRIEAKAALSVKINPKGKSRVLLAKNENEALPIASLTKLANAAVVLENPQIYDLSNQILISPAAAQQDDVPLFGNLMAGQSFNVGDLLNLMLYYSSNDAAFALAEHLGTQGFVDLMNQEAIKLDLAKTNFINPSGLDGQGLAANVSSARDLVAFARYILLKQPGIFDYSIHPGPYLNENGILGVKLGDGQKLVGGKTGFTDLAGGCMLLVFRSQSGSYYFNVILGAASQTARVEEMQKLVDYDNSLSN